MIKNFNYLILKTTAHSCCNRYFELNLFKYDFESA